MKKAIAISDRRLSSRPLLPLEPPGQAGRSLVDTIRKEIGRRADPVRAKAMQAYMKSSMPYRGVPAVPLRSVLQEAFRRHPLSSFEEWRGTILLLWRGAEYREERYAAITLAEQKRYAGFRSFRCLPVY